MGLFDRFKKKKEEEKPEQPEAVGTSLYQAISRYNEYIVRFIGMMQQGNYAPISACEKANGEIAGFLYVLGDDGSYALSAEEVINRMELRFEQQLAAGEIKSYAILYHSQFSNDDNHTLALNDDELKAISIAFHFKNGPHGKIGLPYLFEGESLRFKGFSDFSVQENNSILGTRLQEGKDYFQDREEIVAPVYENEIGLKIKKSNALDVANMWCGIFGFESYQKPAGIQLMQEHAALLLSKEPVHSTNHISISQIEYPDINFKAIQFHNDIVSIIPVVKTDYVVDVVNKGISEWENAENLEAIVSGNGRGSFGLWYFATDYAENRELYLSRKNLNIQISGIIFVLDQQQAQTPNEGPPLSDDFTAYMPNNDLPNYGCFDFIGELEDFRETSLLESGSLKGNILKVRLITNSDFTDFFTIDMYVTPENMRFTELIKGMKLTGMFQMQGRIVG